MFTDVAQAFAAANRIRSMRPRRKVESGASPLKLDGLEESEKGPQGVKIELKDIWFKYPTRDILVLKGLNMTVSLDVRYSVQRDVDSFQIEKGQFAAIVGPSGTYPLS